MTFRGRLKELVSNMLDGKILLSEAVQEFEALYIERALEMNGNHLLKTASTLGIHRNTLSKKLASRNLETGRTSMGLTPASSKIETKKRLRRVIRKAGSSK